MVSRNDTERDDILNSRSPISFLSFDEERKFMKVGWISIQNNRSSAEQAEPEKHCEEASPDCEAIADPRLKISISSIGTRVTYDY